MTLLRRKRGASERSALVTAVGGWRFPVILIGLATALFLLLPVLVIIPVSFSENEFLEFPPHGFSLQWYSEVLDDPFWREAFWTSVQVAALAAALATITGTAAALGVRRVRARSQSWLRTLFIAPIVLPYVVYALGLFNLFDAMRVIGATWPIVVGQAVLAFPIVFIAVSAALSELDPAMTRAAESLGARWPSIVWRVELPPIRLTIAAVSVFAFAFAFDEIVVALFLAAPDTTTLPVGIYTETLESASPDVAAVSGIVMLIAFVSIGSAALLLHRAQRRRA